VGFDREAMVLEVEFHSGGIYQYFGVPEHVYANLVEASSLGQYFNANIKNVYRWRRVN
jgi:hypothetical protein